MTKETVILKLPTWLLFVSPFQKILTIRACTVNEIHFTSYNSVDTRLLHILAQKPQNYKIILQQHYVYMYMQKTKGTYQ